ncbi:AB hydrolase superfamily protein YdjP [Pseudobythopirellula maris]|uniref:AB hydrolase superfamily protein YdjP n=1 Tax=Pseudobythopirellula maris TaxID=2527991 RepID=A0A5C5ZTY0_9BACT|nr:alpha/beta hydrolase [Pseudobythopirellula maris]TWT90889.1 AB hydrolase superfamily protein YdjP [Pseudobythopirellula maris]
MRCLVEGEGPPVLLVHGFPMGHAMWRAQIASLSGVRIIAPDLRGFGGSELGVIHEGQGVSMERYADDLAALLDALGVDEPVVYCGFSMGGYVGWQFLKRHRERVRALVVCDSRPEADDEDGRANRLKMAEKVGEWGSAMLAEAMTPKLFAAETLENDPKLVAWMADMMGSNSPQAIAAALLGMAARPDVTGDLADFDLPTLAICGDQDALTPPDVMRGMAEAMPKAEFVLVEGAGHMAPAEKPVEVNSAIEKFLESLPPIG